MSGFYMKTCGFACFCKSVQMFDIRERCRIRMKNLSMLGQVAEVQFGLHLSQCH